MKKLISLFALCLTVSVLFSQEEDHWVNRINYIQTYECIDSMHCYHEVIMEVNVALFPDSLNLKMIIGTEPEAEDIYSKSYIVAPSLYDNEEVTRMEDGSVQVSLGKYIIPEHFFVDMIISR